MMKNFGKELLLVGCAAGLVLSATACSKIQDHAYSIAEKTENVAAMPEQYRITYEVQKPGEDAVTLVTKARDAKGNIYYSSGAKELLFLEEDGKYRLYEKNENDRFSEDAGGKLYTPDFIDSTAADFKEYAEQSKMQYTPGFKEDEETTVLNRSCRVFKNKVGIAGMNVTYVLQIDKESGICLGYNEVSETGIFTSEPSETVFTCTEFTVDHVELPTASAALQ